MKGLVLGKFMPLHQGHLALIDFARERSSSLIVLLCVAEGESIDGNLREQWLQESYQDQPEVEIHRLDYDPEELPASSESSRAASFAWAKKLGALFPDLEVIFSSEPYGDYVAEYLNIKHVSFDPARAKVSVSATKIRQEPLLYWDYLAPAIRPFYCQRIVLNGTESTGKSTMVKHLAAHYQTSFVPETARDIVAHTERVVLDDLYRIAEAQAQAINAGLRTANRLLFIDTNLITTKAYASFLFQKELMVDSWIEQASQANLYLFLEPDAPYMQDGTRLSLEERNRLAGFHRKAQAQIQTPVRSISGKDWDSRLAKAIAEVDLFLKKFELS